MIGPVFIRCHEGDLRNSLYFLNTIGRDDTVLLASEGKAGVLILFNQPFFAGLVPTEGLAVGAVAVAVAGAVRGLLVTSDTGGRKSVPALLRRGELCMDTARVRESRAESENTEDTPVAVVTRRGDLCEEVASVRVLRTGVKPARVAVNFRARGVNDFAVSGQGALSAVKTCRGRLSHSSKSSGAGRFFPIVLSVVIGASDTRGTEPELLYWREVEATGPCAIAIMEEPS
jgi:hypothetical protein